MLRVVVCVSGGGTNLQAILDAVEAGRITNTEIIAVISNNEGAYALERARAHQIPGIVMSPKAYEDRAEFNRVFTEKMCELAPDLIVLAGFLVKIPEKMVKQFSNRIVNIHPSLIPAFCGQCNGSSFAGISRKCSHRSFLLIKVSGAQPLRCSTQM